MGGSIFVTSRPRALRLRGGKVGHFGSLRLVRWNRLFAILRACGGYGHFSPCHNLISDTLVPSCEIKPRDGVIALLKAVLLSSARWARIEANRYLSGSSRSDFQTDCCWAGKQVDTFRVLTRKQQSHPFSEEQICNEDYFYGAKVGG